MQKQSARTNLVYHNAPSGTPKTVAFKKIILEGLYPEDPIHWSGASMALTMRTFEALKKSDGSANELIDLMLFYVECGTQFTSDYGDIDEDFYEQLETVFEDTLKLIKTVDPQLTIYKQRLEAIKATAHEVGWGYGDQIDDLLDMAFPGMFKI